MGIDLVKQTEDDITSLERLIRKYEALKRLQCNPDFIQLFEKDYLQTKAAECAIAFGSKFQLLSVKDIEKEMIGIGQFRDYMEQIRIRAESAEIAIESHREFLNTSSITE